MRWLTLTDDPNSASGGTSLDDVAALVGAAIPLPDAEDALVVTTANVDAGNRTLDRDDDVRGTRANSQPVSFAAAPSLTFGSRAWNSTTKRLLRAAMTAAAPAVTGAPPAAVQSTLAMAQSGILPSFIGTLVREDQVDQVTGLWVNEFTLNLPAEGEGTIEGTLMGLYHDVNDVGDADMAGLPNIAGVPGQADAYMLRDVYAVQGDGVGVPIDCLGGFGFTINNNLSDDFRTRFCAGRNVADYLVDGFLHRLWYPDKNKLGPQTVTGRLDYGDTRPDRELRRLVNHAEKLVVELSGPPLGTTPPADDMIRLVFAKQAPTGGGAEPLQRDGDQQSSYEFTAYIDDATGKDLEAVFIGDEAIA